jgi:hypothetical protein
MSVLQSAAHEKTAHCPLSLEHRRFIGIDLRTGVAYSAGMFLRFKSTSVTIFTQQVGEKKKARNSTTTL